MMTIKQAARSSWSLAIACLLLGACAPEQRDSAASIKRGGELFDENCSPCHGAQGRGPSMDDIRSLSPDGLRAAIRNHPTAGQIPERLPAARVQEIIEFLEE
jgi:mono/diheme cytochrome c family protein